VSPSGPGDDGRPADIEELLLGGPRRHTRDEAAASAGVSVEYARRLWRAMGFADVGDSVPAFTDGDLDALRRLMVLVRDGVLDDELAVSMTRAMGHNAARLVEWQVDALVEHLVRTRGLTADEAAREAVAMSATHAEELQSLLAFVWRRQLAAASGRALASADGDPDSGVLAVGFADMVSFTRLAQRLDQRELAALVDRFDARCADIIAAAGGRLIKTVGDEVLFVSERPADAVRIGLELAEAMAADPVLPDVRVGIATGAVVTRMGDVFGRTVNLASRLTALAQPGTVLVDRRTAVELAGHDEFDVDVERTRAVRGMGLVRPGLVRRRSR
jgi:adenylate cyclase